MFDTPNNTGRWQMPRPSITRLLFIALAFSLIFSGYLLSRLNGRTQVASQAAPVSPTASSSSGQPVPGSTAVAPDIDVLMAQLQDMQNNLQATSILLAQKGQDAGLVIVGSSAPTWMDDEDLSTLLTEIEQLYQVMQPLMVQVEMATATRSSRSNSELIALRTQVNTIHQRQAYLLARVEAIKGRANAGTGATTTQWAAPAGSTTTMTSPDPAMVDQLYRNMTELQSLLQQLESRGTVP